MKQKGIVLFQLCLFRIFSNTGSERQQNLEPGKHLHSFLNTGQIRIVKPYSRYPYCRD